MLAHPSVHSTAATRRQVLDMVAPAYSYRGRPWCRPCAADMVAAALTRDWGKTPVGLFRPCDPPAFFQEDEGFNGDGIFCDSSGAPVTSADDGHALSDDGLFPVATEPGAGPCVKCGAPKDGDGALSDLKGATA